MHAANNKNRFAVDLPKSTKDKISLYKALKIGYTRDINKQKKALKNYGYVIDSGLTRPREQVVAYNPTNKKLLLIENGTDVRSGKDLATDLLLATGSIKETRRVEDAKNAIMKARKKYNVPVENINIASHSLGGQISNMVVPSGANAYNYNAAYIPGQKARPNVHNFRTKGDIFSAYSPQENTKVLENKHENEKNINYLLKSHEIENIKNLPVFF